MFAAFFVILLGIISAALVLGGVAFYAGWDTQRRIQDDLERLLHRPPKA